MKHIRNQYAKNFKKVLQEAATVSAIADGCFSGVAFFPSITSNNYPKIQLQLTPEIRSEAKKFVKAL